MPFVFTSFLFFFFLLLATSVKGFEPIQPSYTTETIFSRKGKKTSTFCLAQYYNIILIVFCLIPISNENISVTYKRLLVVTNSLYFNQVS
nr:MAG TPA: hypothetical protein [Caudoviricetes sp.]